MRKSVVEKQALAFLPMRDRIADANTARFFFFRNDQPEMITNDAFVRAAVFGYVFATGEDREKCGLRARNFLQQSRRLRAAAKIVLRTRAISEKKERLPFVVLRDLFLVRGNV